MFRPGGIIPERGVKSKTPLYNAIYVIMRPFFGLVKKMSNNITTSVNVGLAMIQVVLHPNDQKHLENPDINQLAKS
jgi:hypothetical protein